MSDLAQLQLDTLFVSDADGFLLHTREPNATPAPRLFMVRTPESVAWAVRADAPPEIAELAAQERPVSDLRGAPMHVARYVELLGGAVDSGPAYVFPDDIDIGAGAELVRDPRVLPSSFTPDEIEGRSPIYAVIQGDAAIALCHCARRSDVAAEAGVFTSAEFRGRGYAPTVTAAWAAQVRASGRLPLYSTSWQNTSSQRVAAKLRLRMYAADFSVA